jgi:stage 0 sporulation regulatory protein
MKTNVISLKELEDKIAVLRNRMIDTVKIKGFTHPDSIRCSQELDCLLNKYQKAKLPNGRSSMC